MHYIGRTSDVGTHAYLKNEFKDFATTYPDVDLFAVDLHEIDTVSEKIENSKVVIYYADHPPYDGLYVFFELFRTHSDKQFIMLNDAPCWQELADWPSNVQWVFHNVHSNLVSWDGGYRTTVCLLDKNFDSDKVGISLNRMPRNHRLCCLSYMLGAGLDETCVITAPLLAWHLENEHHKDIMNVVDWDFDLHDNFKHIMLAGWNRAQTGDGIFAVETDAYPPYDTFVPTLSGCYNFENFKTRLAPLYKNSFVEFINSTVYDYSLPWICEKPLNSQLACNFPIFLAGTDTVQWYRDNGFDMFDDIVDHSYDREEDPVLRLQKLVSDNRVLLSDTSRTKDLWTKNYTRFEHNVQNYFAIADQTAVTSSSTLKTWIDNV